jgi:uncharacterized membrane protein YqjE
VAPSGIAAWLRAVGDALLADVRDRVALLALEVEEEKWRLIETLVAIGAAMITGVMMLALASLTLVILFWDTARLGVIAGLAGFHGLLFSGIVLWLRQRLARLPRPFAATLAEIEKDRQCLRDRN